ncbi:MAG: EAL domain-containing protein [Erythrobacter sp.]|jgi:EAL domain-containing protein (putative c-di-GMP-specific phosphodiesterase class I)/CHASE2 domain-containing sensor protein|nr:EAL domain-containing protein [Erythrobacter sp.]
MTPSLASLAGLLRRIPGRAEKRAPEPPEENVLQSGEALLRRKRNKVAIFAILFGLVSAAIDLPLPAEDAYRAVRAQLRSRPAPPDIVMVTVDDATLNELGKELPSRSDDSALVDRLVAAGVDKIVFDRAHADPETPASDATFERMLERHKGKVWLGMTPSYQIKFQKIDRILPLERFRQHAAMASMTGFASPFSLSVVFPTSVEIDGTTYPSISAALAGYDGSSLRYRPDFAFNPWTIPTYSYVDVLKGRVPASKLRGRSVIIGRSFFESSDFLVMPLKGRVPGSYFHVIGAQTLKSGVPTDLYWFPAMLIVVMAIGSYTLGRSRSARPLWFAAVGLPLLAFPLDEVRFNIDIMPAMLALGFAGIGFHRIAKKYYSSDVDAMTTSALSLDKGSAALDVYALRIANLAEMSEEWSPRELGEFVNSLITYIKGPGEAGDVAFERDSLVWLAPRMDKVSLERHADGLALMLKTAISYDWQSASSTPAIGIDTNYSLPLGQRIKKAMQAADEAANRGVRFIINDAAYVEARNYRLEIMRVLEKGLRERKIGVAYQPKIDLATGRIVGAETLIRWKPDGQDFVNPQELVLAAEASDRINELTMIVMEAALVDGREAIALDPGFKLAINMSAKSLSDTHLLFDMMTMLGRIGFPAENLTLELTETAKLEDKLIAPQISALNARGIGLSIDDFGTGQSNLEYLEKLPSSELKIDKKFVQHMATSEESHAVVRATIEIAHSLGKVVVAEGVETEAVADQLRAMGCDQAQGFLFSQAIAMPELLIMMGGKRIVVNA